MSDGADSRPGRWALLEGVAVAAVALWALGFQLWLPSTHVDEADYLAVAKVLEAEARPGDVVLLHPWWTERARLYLPEGVEVVGHLFSDEADLSQHARIWLLEEPRLPLAGEGDFHAGFDAQRTPVGAARDFGNLSLRLYDNGRYRPVVFSALALLPSLHVFIEGPGGAREACPWNGQRHQCPGGRAVGAEWHEVHFVPRRCLRFDAPGGDQRLVVELPPQPAAGRVTLRTGYTGERGSYTAAQGVTDTQVGLEADGRTATLTLPVGVEAPQSSALEAVPAGATVRAWVQSRNALARELCLELWGDDGRAP